MTGTDGAAVPRRQQILAVAAEQFALRGAKTTTVRVIAGLLGIKPGSLYHHFISKDEMLVEILGAYLEDLLASYRKMLAETPGSEARLRSLITTSLAVSDRHPHAAEIFQAEQQYMRELPDTFSNVLEDGRQVQAIWSQAINAGAKDGTFRRDVSAATFHRLLRDALWLSVRWFKPTRQHPTDELAREIASIFLDGYLAGE